MNHTTPFGKYRSSKKKKKSPSSLMVQQVKDPALSLQQLGSLPWCRFDSWPRELSNAMGVTKTNKKNHLPQNFDHFLKEKKKNSLRISVVAQ